MSLPVSDHIERGEAALASRQFEQAKLNFEAVLRQQPTHPRAHHMLAVIADLQHQYSKAEQHYHAALQADVGNAAIIGDLGYSYLRQERYDLAEQYLTQARALDPSHINATRNLALLHSRRGNYHGARQALEQILPAPEVERTLSQLFPAGYEPPANPNQHPQLADGPAGDAPAADPTLDLKARMDAAARQSILERQQREQARSLAEQQRRMQAMALQQQAEMRSRHPSAATGAAAPGRPPAADPEYRRVAAELAAINRQGSGRGPTGSPRERVVGHPESPYYPQPQPTVVQPTPQEISPAVGARQSPSPILQPVTPVDHQQAAPRERAWPPSTWPPKSAAGEAAVDGHHVPGGDPTSVSPQRPRSGVIHLMNRPTTAAEHDATESTSQYSRRANAPRSIEPVELPHTGDASYSRGPGNSRVVTWPRSEPVSLPQVSPQTIQSPPTDLFAEPEEEPLQPDPAEEAAEIGLDLGGQHPFPVPRLTPVGSPGTGSVLSGRQFPQPERDLPGMPVVPQVEPRAFETPADPLNSYSQNLAEHDQRRNRAVEQSYGQTPANHIESPARHIPAPMNNVPVYPYRSGEYSSPPVNHQTGTPWPSRPAEVPGINIQPEQQHTAAPPSYSSNEQGPAGGFVVPPRYNAAPANTAVPSVSASPAPPEFSHRNSPAPGYAGPMIVPGSPRSAR